MSHSQKTLRATLPLLVASLLLLNLLGACSEKKQPSEARFSVVEASFEDMQSAMADGHISSREIVEQYLDRIARYERRLRGTMTTNPSALAIADALDAERAAGKVRGPLHGIPIALKDNIHTVDMPTTGGALAFKDYIPPYEATLVTRLREAGAIILAKTTMTELANWVGTGMPGNYNTLRGYGLNPYDPRPDPREQLNDGRSVLDTGGSSSGIGTAANFWAANVGTETSGSILSPANDTLLVGIKPTVGRVSRHGIIPITADQDTAGPLAKSVADAAALLAAMEGEDSHDDATGICAPPADGSYRSHLNAEGLRGARIGIPRALFYEQIVPPGGTEPVGGLEPAQTEAMTRVIALLESLGAVVVDPANMPSTVATDPQDNHMLFGVCYDQERGKGGDEDCSIILKYGMKRDFNRWLHSLGDNAPLASLTELREFNTTYRAAGTLRYGQAQLDISDEMDVTGDHKRWRQDRDKDIRLSRTEGIDAALREHELDALLLPAWSGEEILNKAGYPAVIVPFTLLPRAPDPPLPADFSPEPAPFGVAFYGTACSEGRLIELAFAFEQASKGRVPPKGFP